jgi:hypothetical protein
MRAAPSRHACDSAGPARPHNSPSLRATSAATGEVQAAGGHHVPRR